MKTGEEIIKEFEVWAKAQNKSENTVTTYRGVLQKFYQWLIEDRGKDVFKVTKNDVQAYINLLDEQQNKSASTIDKVFASIRVFAQFLERIDIVENVEKKKEKNIYQTTPQSLTTRERETLLKKVEQDGNLRNTAIVYTLLYTGIRISELCNLHYADIEIKKDKGTLIVRNSQKDKQRVIPLPKHVIYHLCQYIDSLETKSETFFVSSKGNHGLSARAVQYMLKNYNITPIKLRHTFCQDLIDKGVDLAMVAQLSGHNDINMTKRYKSSS